MSCVFCRIVRGEVPAAIVWEGEDALAFLDHRPLFPGHVLLVPRAHHETLVDLPAAQVGPFFVQGQRIAAAVERVVGAQGTFVAINNRVSQSVPHLHLHVVPRTRGDGLKGFFWPRHPYREDAEREAVASALRQALAP
ncbi:HIT family protein [Vulgatibacter sp.]|uniref:HIT family protein n=1 Tax=Vulgatibacter sp. TaxID=1971226 RepID=UPI0035672FC8